jgi:hypothetical protein
MRIRITQPGDIVSVKLAGGREEWSGPLLIVSAELLWSSALVVYLVGREFSGRLCLALWCIRVLSPLPSTPAGAGGVTR